jgi:protein phosphatase
MNHSRLAGIAGLTHVGRRRRSNQDAIAWDGELGLALVADGVGGGNAGEIASATAARSVTGDLRSAMRIADRRRASHESRSALARELVRRANQRILATADREPDTAGMQTTLAMTLLGEDFVTIATLGDSRIYRLRNGTLERLTRDHSLADELGMRGLLSASQVARSTLRNTLSRALGMQGSPEADIAHHELESGDLLMLCTDGLTKAVSDTEIAALLTSGQRRLDELAAAAVELANRRGGRDNISVIVLQIA